MDAPLVDTHAHLDFSQFDEDREQVLDRACSEGVTRIVTVGFDLDSSRQVVGLTGGNASLWACVGVHPHQASQVTPEGLESLKDLSAHHNVVAIGEVGLDYYRDRSPRDVQRQVFRQQLELAADTGKPVVIHDRAAHGDVMRIVRGWAEAVSSSSSGLKPPLGVVHCFSGDRTMAEELFELGFYISVAGSVTFPNAAGLQELVRRLPVDRLLLETDCPFLSPHPHRGKRNEPANVKLVAQKIAEIKDMSLEDVSRVTTENACRVFRLE
jgi:TatD DNase family protein